MEKRDTGSALIHRFDGAVDPAICQRLCDLIRSQTATRSEPGSDKLPWHDSDTHSFDHWQDQELRKLIGAYRIMLCQLLALSLRTIVFPHFTDLVLWRPGKKMAEHKDDGYEADGDTLSCRHFTSVTYCNDGYGGGETFIRNEHGGHYVSRPLCGTLIFFPSDERCTHGVNEVFGQNRITLSTWLTRDANFYRA